MEKSFRSKVRGRRHRNDGRLIPGETEKTNDYDGTVFVTHTYYVTYENRTGETVEAELPDPKQKLEVGNQVKIRYLPNRQNHPIFLEVL